MTQEELDNSKVKDLIGHMCFYKSELTKRKRTWPIEGIWKEGLVLTNRYNYTETPRVENILEIKK